MTMMKTTRTRTNNPRSARMSISSVRSAVSAEEWQTRVDLAAAYRLVALFGWDDLIFTHVTAKVPGTGHFLINPYGLSFEEITASSLVKVDLAGQKVMDSAYPVNPAGFLIHGCIHAARKDAGCVMHTHSLNGVAISAQRRGLLPISQQAFIVLSSLAYHDYEGIALSEEEKPRLVRDLGDKTFFMLRNHGLLTVGKSAAEAFLAMYVFEAACIVQVRAQGAGGELIAIRKEILELAPSQFAQVTLGGGGALAWPALLRRLDRHNPGYAG
jgi:ribulose-5-phosphate 4-epimerase/fuculose-1-phosphate aldolase